MNNFSAGKCYIWFDYVRLSRQDHVSTNLFLPNSCLYSLSKWWAGSSQLWLGTTRSRFHRTSQKLLDRNHPELKTTFLKVKVIHLQGVIPLQEIPVHWNCTTETYWLLVTYWNPRHDYNFQFTWQHLTCCLQNCYHCFQSVALPPANHVQMLLYNVIK